MPEQLSLLGREECEHLFKQLHHRVDPILRRLGFGHVLIQDETIKYVPLERRIVAALDELEKLKAARP